MFGTLGGIAVGVFLGWALFRIADIDGFNAFDIPTAQRYEGCSGWTCRWSSPTTMTVSCEASPVRPAACRLPCARTRRRPTASPGSIRWRSRLRIAPRIDAWIVRLDELGVEHSLPLEATSGWVIAFQDPDGIELRLYSKTP